MKKTNTYFWICTGLFGAFMLFSAIPDIMVTKEAVDFIGTLGYPTYFIPFIGVAKALGVFAIVFPGQFPRIKEWAYAGLFFDLIGAVYSGIMTGGFDPMMLTMIVPFGLGGLSYYFHHERMKAATA